MIKLQKGEVYLLFGAAHAGKTTLAFDLATRSANGLNINYIPTEIYKGTLEKWEPHFHKRGWTGKLNILQVPGWGPEDTLSNLFALMGDRARFGLVPGKNKAGDEIMLRSYHLDGYGEASKLKELADAGERIFIFDSIAAPIKAVFEFAADLHSNLGPRDSCMSRLLWYAGRLAILYDAIVILVDHQSLNEADKYAKPKPYGPGSSKYLCKYWLRLDQSDAKEHTDIHQLIVTRNVTEREYEEQYYLQLTAEGFQDLTKEQMQEIMKRKGA